MGTCIYVVDQRDRIISLSGNWLDFAVKNQAEETCHPDRIINEPLWRFIDGTETRHLYEVCLARIRSRRNTVVLPFRCDAPDRRRYLELTISSLPGDCIQFASRVLREERRENVDLLRCDLPRSDDFVTMCSMCKKVKIPGNTWIEVEMAIATLKLFEREVLPNITHGICPDCSTIFMKQFEELKAKLPSEDV